MKDSKLERIKPVYEFLEKFAPKELKRLMEVERDGDGEPVLISGDEVEDFINDEAPFFEDLADFINEKIAEKIAEENEGIEEEFMRRKEVERLQM